MDSNTTTLFFDRFQFFNFSDLSLPIFFVWLTTGIIASTIYIDLL